MNRKFKIISLLIITIFIGIGAVKLAGARKAEENKTEDPSVNQQDKGIKEEIVKEKPLAFVKKYTSIKAGKTKQFKVNKKVAKWNSSNKKVAVVLKTGKVKALRYGKTTITAKSGKDTVRVRVEVLPKKIVGIDPGHQLHANGSLEPNGPNSSVMKAKVTGGTCGCATGKSESALMLEIGLLLKEELESRGYMVVMTRNKQNVNISNAQRALKLNEKCNIAVRLHADGLENQSVSGASMQCSTSSNPYIARLFRKCKRLSKCILSAYCKETRRRNRGICYRDDLTGTNFSTIPVTLIEMGFMSNRAEDYYMASANGQKAMVNGIANGIDKYFNYFVKNN